MRNPEEQVVKFPTEAGIFDYQLSFGAVFINFGLYVAPQTRYCDAVYNSRGFGRALVRVCYVSTRGHSGFGKGEREKREKREKNSNLISKS